MMTSRLRLVSEEREQTFPARETGLPANPPRPKDLIIRYRVAETPLEGDWKGGVR